MISILVPPPLSEEACRKSFSCCRINYYKLISGHVNQRVDTEGNMGASGWWRNKHEWGGGTNLSSTSDWLKKVIFSRVILRSVTVIKISLVPVLCPGNERQTEGAGERPNVIDTQWKQCVRKPKPCYRSVHNKTLGNYSNRPCMTRGGQQWVRLLSAQTSGL